MRVVLGVQEGDRARDLRGDAAEEPGGGDGQGQDAVVARPVPLDEVLQGPCAGVLGWVGLG